MNINSKLKIFFIPFFVFVCLIISLLIHYSGDSKILANYIAFLGILAGSLTLIIETVKSLFKRVFALDYIAILAIGTSVYTGQYFVALVIVLMLSGGNALELYATAKAKKSLNSLINRIPARAMLWKNGKIDHESDIKEINVGDIVAIRRGEVIPLDGTIYEGQAMIDESSLTGEAYTVEKSKGDTVHSGTLNIGNLLTIKVSKRSDESSYTKIVQLVERAAAQKAPIVRLADRYSNVFLAITLFVCALAYYLSHDIGRVLAVLVVATPCPLILATPIALFGGMNKSAAKNILIKNPASLEVLNRITDVVFDKTGTITIGRPIIEKLEILDRDYSQEKIYSIAEAIERNSLHPFAKTIVKEAHNQGVPTKSATDIREQIGLGIIGIVDGTTYALTRSDEDKHSISMLRDTKLIAHFFFEDRIKEHFSPTLNLLKNLNINLHIFTGDKLENTKKIIEIASKDSHISINAEMKPEQKENGVNELKKAGKIVAMIGDGINDAPALASADVGMVFSNEEQTASSEAADIVLLQGNLDTVMNSIGIANRTINIALQSIIFGIGLSVIAMVLAAFGIIPPIAGALLQEGIDVIVIFNALRASI